MKFEVRLTLDAARDLEEIYNYIAENDAPANANHVLKHIERVIDNLATFPERGSFPKELLRLGIREYRQNFFKPYRIIYRIIYRVQNKIVYVYVIADGRRDMQALLARRMLDI